MGMCVGVSVQVVDMWGIQVCEVMYRSAHRRIVTLGGRYTP